MKNRLHRWMKADAAGFSRLDLLVAFISGGLLPLAFAPVNAYPLVFILPALLFFLFYRASLQQATAWQVARLGYLFGLGLFLAGVSWVYVAIHDFGLSSVLIAGLLTLLFVALLAVYFALQAYAGAWLGRRLQLRQPFVLLVLVFPACWVLLEWFRGWFLTGFPWLNLGYSQLDTPLAGYAPVLGVYGVSWLVAMIAGLLACLATQTRYRLAYVTSIVVILGVGLVLKQVHWTVPVDEPLQVALVQGNMPQKTKWDENAVYQRIERYTRLTRPHWGKDLVVWPENSMTAFYHQLDAPFLQVFNQEAQAANTQLIIGIPYLDQETYQYYSSFMTLGVMKPQFYHKTHLVPFGEYLPFNDLLRGLINFFAMPMSNFSRGAWLQPLLQVKGQKVASTICYEDAFGEELIRYLPEASLLVNGSNNAWYGDSLAPHQHLQIARMRALETGRDLLRATTNGISALVNAQGVIMARSRQFESAVVSGQVQPRQGATPYVRWGNYPVLLLLAGLMLGLWLRMRSRSG